MPQIVYLSLKDGNCGTTANTRPVACNAKLLQMKLQTKKIIAKEFLILTITAFLGLIAFLGTYPYNYFQKNNIDKLNKSISEKTKIADSLSSSYNIKEGNQNWFFNKYFDKVETEFNTSDELWKRLDDLAQKDSIKYKWEKVWNKELVAFLKETGFPSGDNFNSFILSSRITTADLQNYNQSTKVKKEINNLKSKKGNIKSSILSFNQQAEFGLKCFIVAAILFFCLRYLYYSIRWSIKTLKQQNE